jgi:hypothetical protein
VVTRGLHNEGQKQLERPPFSNQHHHWERVSFPDSLFQIDARHSSREQRQDDLGEISTPVVVLCNGVCRQYVLARLVAAW